MYKPLKAKTKVSMKQKTIKTLAFLTILLMLTIFPGGCIPVSIPKEPSSVETDKITLEAEQDQNISLIRVAPFYNDDTVDQISEELLKTDEDIKILHRSKLWELYFSRKTDREVALTDLLTQQTRNLFLSKDIIFLVVVYSHSTEKSTGEFLFWPFYTESESTSCAWLLYDLAANAEPQFYLTEVGGKGRGGWIPAPFIGFFFPKTDPKTEKGAISGLAQKLVEEIKKATTNRPLKISIIGGKINH